MANQTYVYTATEIIACEKCQPADGGTVVDISLRQDLNPALPESIRGIVLLVNGLEYTIQYDDADLLGAVPSLTDEIVSSVDCVPCLTLAQEYSDERDDGQDITIQQILDVLAMLGIVPSDGTGQTVVHSDSAPGVSVAVVKHSKITVTPGNSESILTEVLDMANQLSVVDMAGKSFIIETDVSVISSDSLNDKDSLSSHRMVGGYNQGATVNTLHSKAAPNISITASPVGNSLNVSVQNNTTVDVDFFLTATFRILS